MDEPNTPRQRYREEVRSQVKKFAEAQLAELGPDGLSLSAIARELGMSGPALYRYFASRDAVLTELVLDAYNDLADAVEGTGAGDEQTSSSRLRGFLSAYRAWGVANPHRYRLLFQPPVPGFDPNEPALVAAAQRSMAALIGTIGSAQPPEEVARAAGPLLDRFGEVIGRWGLSVPPSALLHATLIWSRIHGFVSLEISGNFALTVADGEALFAAELASICSVF